MKTASDRNNTEVGNDPSDSCADGSAYDSLYSDGKSGSDRYRNDKKKWSCIDSLFRTGGIDCIDSLFHVGGIHGFNSLLPVGSID